MDWKALLFTFDGRINRAKFWLGVLFIVLNYLAAGIIFGIFYALAGENIGMIIGGIALLVALVVAIWVSFAIVIKRLHDREKSGWWSVVFIVIPGILNGIGQVIAGIGGGALSLASLAIYIWAIIELGCLKGTAGPNMHGPDPLPAEPD